MSGSQSMAALDAVHAPGGAAAEPTARNQVRIEVEDAAARPLYSTTSRVWGSAEEVYVDLGSNLRPGGKNRAILQVDQRLILSPWAAKRLAIAMTQVVAHYERTYGPLELDPARRGKTALGGTRR